MPKGKGTPERAGKAIRESDRERAPGTDSGEPQTQHKKVRLPKRLFVFGGIILLECALAAGCLVLLAFMSFRLRLSADVIRIGITCLYILPCLLGGSIARRARLSPNLVWGAGVGAAYYALLLAAAVIVAGNGRTVGVWTAAMCILSGVLGAGLGKKPKGQKEQGR